jgi:hypothetical protein
MDRPKKQAIHSGFAQFADQKASEHFIRDVLDSNPGLKSRAYISKSRPTIIFERLTAGERDEIVSALADRGRWFDDMQFQTTS